MKATILTSVLAIFLSIANIYASEPKAIVYSNEESTTSGLVKEYITYDADNAVALSKTAYYYNCEGLVQKKVTSKWDSKTGWTGIQKYDYECNNTGKVVNLIYTAWDDKLNTWSSKSEQFVHVYNAEGELLATKQIHIDNEALDFISQK